MMKREAIVSGKFYPKEKEGLKEMIKGFIENAETKEVMNGIIVPHAGYVYSGKTAGIGYKAMLNVLKQQKDIDNIIILGPSHQWYFERVLNDESQEWETPLGAIKTQKISDFKDDSQPHSKEHSIEVQVPFIQYVAEQLGRELTITPLIVGEISEYDAIQAAKVLAKKENCFFVVSTDLSHYLPQSYAAKIDEETINKIMHHDSSELEACGKHPLMIAIELAKIKRWEFEALDYSTSAETSGDEASVVGYVCIGF